MIPVLFAALPVAGLAALLVLHRSHQSDKKARREDLRDTAEALSVALEMHLGVSGGPLRSGHWELSGRPHGRDTRIWVSNATTATIAVKLWTGLISAVHPNELRRGGLDGTSYVRSTHPALPEGWFYRGPAAHLDALPPSLEQWLRAHPADGVVEGRLMLNRTIADVPETLRGLRAALSD
ncbi:MAG: hypothetical protein AB8H86_07180 [Polyangiales bacterium]